MEDKWAHAVKAPCKNWPGDYVHENGNYENECMFCHDKFYGHKRRVVCHLCNDLTKDQIAYVVSLEEKISNLYAEQYGSADWVDMKITPLEEEIKRLKDRGLELANDLVKANQKLITASGEIEQWKETAHAERELNKILGERIAKLLERNKELDTILRKIEVLDLLDKTQQENQKINLLLTRLYDDYKRNALDIHHYMDEIKQIITKPFPE